MSQSQSQHTVNVNVKSAGMPKLKAQWLDFTGALLAPLAVLASGGSKAQAAWEGVKSVFLLKVLGPLEMGVGASTAFLAVTAKLVKQWKELGMTSAATLERMTVAFRPLLGSMELAKQRVKELMQFTAKTPFRLEETAAANQILQSLTRGALATSEGMYLVGDAAAVANAGFEETARNVGRLYDGLMSGRPVGEAAMRLQELGIITGATRNQIESMQALQKSGNEIWAVVEKEISKSKGAMADLSKTLEGLQSTYADTVQQLQAGFSGKFMEGEKAGVQAATKMMEALQPAADALGDSFAGLDNWWEKMKLRIVETVTASGVFSESLKWIVKGVLGLAGAISAAGAVAIAGFTAKLLLAAAGMRSAAQSQTMLNAAQGASVPVLTKLRAMKDALTASMRANAAGAKAEAAAHAQGAAGYAKSIVTTNGVVAAKKGAALAMRGMGMAARFVGAQMKMMMLSMLTNPIFLVIGALTAAAEVFNHYAEKAKKAREEQKNYEDGTSSLVSKLTKENREIRTMIDLRRQEQAVITELAKAYREMETSANPGVRSAAGARVVELEKQLAEVRGKRGGVVKTDREYALEKELREDAKSAERARDDIRAGKGPEEELAVVEKRWKVARDRMAAAQELERQEKAAEDRAAKAREEAGADAIREQQILAQIAKEQASMEDNAGGTWESAGETQQRQNAAAARKAELEKELAVIQARRAGGGGEIGAMLNSGSEMMVLNAKVAAYFELMGAMNAVTDAKEKLATAEEKDKKAAADAVTQAERHEAALRKVAEQAGVANWQAGDRENAKIAAGELEARRSQDLSQTNMVGLTEAERKARLAVVQAELDTAQAVDGIKLRGESRELRMLEMEREKLRLAHEAGSLGEKQYARALRENSAKREVLAREAREKKEVLQAAFMQAHLERGLSNALRDGDKERAEKMLKAQQEHARATELAAAERDAREIQGQENQKKFVQWRMLNFDAEAAAAEKARQVQASEAREEAQNRVRSGADFLEAQLLRRQGRGREAYALEEQSRRRSEQLESTKRQRELQESGMSAAEAKRIALAEMKQEQGSRALERIFSQKGTVVASSLAQIGGGGGVYGNDPSTRTLERAVKVLEQIRDNTRDHVGVEF